MREQVIPRELTARALNLTLALYRVTDLLPYEEPLRRDIREKGGEIFAAVVSARHSADPKGDRDSAWVATEILLGYLVMARTLGCINPMNFLVLEREYRGLRDALSRIDAPPAGRTYKKPAPRARGKKNEPAKMAQTQEEKSVPKQVKNGEVHPHTNVGAGAGERQKAIIGHLSDNRQAKISDFYETFDGVSSKTIQRDLQDLVVRNLIKKEGDKRWTTYTLV